MLRRFSVNFAIFSGLVDAVVVAIMLYLSSVVRPLLGAVSWIAPIAGAIVVPAPLYVLFPVCWVGILASFAIYDGKRYVRAVDEFAALSLASALAAVTQAGVLYISFRDVSRAQYLLFVLSSFVALLIWRAVARALFRLRRQRLPEVARRVLIVGTGPIGRMVESRLSGSHDLDLTLAGFVDDEPADGFSGTLLGRNADLRALVVARDVSDVIIALPPHFYEQVRMAVACLTDIPVRVWIALGFFELALYRTATEDFGGVPLLDLRASALDDYERIIKRAFDLVIGCLALVASAPLLAVAGIAILLEDGSPILFRQKRVGENGRLFEMLKLRTMVRNAEDLRQQVESRDASGQIVHKSRDDPRITRVGRILRRMSIDELPQLINVLRGDMSIVGPRPELPYLVEQYEPWQRQRLAVPPGITGWWQVTGRSEKVMHLHTEEDLYYLENYSIWLDLQIIMRTVWVVLMGRGAY